MHIQEGGRGGKTGAPIKAGVEEEILQHLKREK